MKVRKKQLGKDAVLVEAVASTEEVSAALNEAQALFAYQMGLRPAADQSLAGAAEEQLGIKDLDAVVQPQALEALVPFAIDKSRVTPAFPPRPEASFPPKRGQTFQFSLHIAPKPDYELSSYEPVSFDVPAVAVEEEHVDERLAEIAERYADYVACEPHPVRKGDSCLISLESSVNGEKLPGLTSEGRSYTTGAGLMPADFDEEVVGMEVGETKTFTIQGPGMDAAGRETTDSITCTVTVKEIQEKVTPVIDDEWLGKNMPAFSGVDELRAAVREELSAQLAHRVEELKRTRAADELAKRFQGSIADAAYEAMSRNILNTMRAQVRQQGAAWEQFVEEQGGEQQFNMMVMMQTRQMLVQGYALDALFRHEKLSVREEDVQEACLSMNPQDPQGARLQMEKAGRGYALREVAERIRANKWLVEHARIAVQEGAQ